MCYRYDFGDMVQCASYETKNCPIGQESERLDCFKDHVREAKARAWTGDFLVELEARIEEMRDLIAQRSQPEFKRLVRECRKWGLVCVPTGVADLPWGL